MAISRESPAGEPASSAFFSASVSRAAITAAYRRPETEAVSMLLEQARLPQPVAEQAHKLAYQLADKLRNQKNASGRAGMVQGLLQEFSLSSQEGVALMCLAEALLRIPDKATRDALIRDKISNGNWQGGVVPLNRHAQRVAYQHDVKSFIGKEFGEAIVVSGDGRETFFFLFAFLQ